MASIIWSENDKRTAFEDFSFIEALDLESLINININKKFNETSKDIRMFFTVDNDTIAMREELFTELLNDNNLFEKLDKSFNSLGGFFELERLKENAVTKEQLLYSIRSLETYVEYLNSLKNIFSEHEVKSSALQSLWQAVKPICADPDFAELSAVIGDEIHTISRIKSITVGVNLNADLTPIEAGVVSVHEESYISGNFIDKLLRLEFKENEFMCAAPLVPLKEALKNEEFAAMRVSLNSALNKVFESSLKSWAQIVRKYGIRNLYSLAGMLDEWRFVSACVKSLRELIDIGCKLCIPKIAAYDEVTSLYHPILALAAGNGKGVIKNDLRFDGEAGIYILTGPNQGGKSIYTQAVGLMYAMLHLGLPIPAEKASLRPVDAILVHFIDIKKRSYVHGRLSDECDKIHKLNRIITKNSLFLFDEALSSTDADEAVSISGEIITAYSDIGARGIWTTHYHELCRLEYDYTNALSKIKNISAQINEHSHERVYKIMLGELGKSYAIDIAKRYNLTKEDILKEQKQ